MYSYIIFIAVGNKLWFNVLHSMNLIEIKYTGPPLKKYGNQFGSNLVFVEIWQEFTIRQ